jgi:hypothetical protein
MGCAGNKKQYQSFLSKIFYLIIKYFSTYFWTGSAALEEQYIFVIPESAWHI